MGKAPSGILKVFLVLPEGEKNFIRSPVGDLKRFILPEGEENFIRSPVGDLKRFIARSMVGGVAVVPLECEPLGEKKNWKKPSPRQGPRRVGVRASHGQSSLRYP